MDSNFIPDYNKYSTFELIEIYRRIDRNNHLERLKAIEVEIKVRMNLAPDIDLSKQIEPAVLDKKINEYFKNQKKKEKIKKESKSIYFTTSFYLLVSISLLCIKLFDMGFAETTAFKIIIGANILALTYSLFLNIYKEKTVTRFISINKEDNRGLYYYNIIMTSIMIIILLLVIF